MGPVLENSGACGQREAAEASKVAGEEEGKYSSTVRRERIRSVVS